MRMTSYQRIGLFASLLSVTRVVVFKNDFRTDGIPLVLVVVMLRVNSTLSVDATTEMTTGPSQSREMDPLVTSTSSGTGSVLQSSKSSPPWNVFVLSLIVGMSGWYLPKYVSSLFHSKTITTI